MSFIEDLFGVSDKTALVTGAATGIGRMMAEALVQAGARVLIASRKGDACEAVAGELNGLGAPGSAEGFAGDVATAEGCAALAEAVQARTDKLHILVNNAGKSWGAKYEEFPFDAWDKVMSVNVAGLFTVTRDMTPLLKAAATAEDPARVVNIGSVAGETPTGRSRLLLFRLQGRRAPPDPHPRQGAGAPPRHRERAGAGAVRLEHDQALHAVGRDAGADRA